MKKNSRISIPQIIILVVAAVLIGCVIIVRLLPDRAEDAPSAAFPKGWEVQDYDEYLEAKKDVPSDIEGLSQYEKYEMGLDYHDGSDSDYDGLTDKEEIEIYHTDPLKASTAGDLYTDGYKVEQGMDLFTPAEYKEPVVFQYNQCEEISLEADEPTDFYAVVEDCTDLYTLKDYGINALYAGYVIYNYNGPVTIDISGILSENELSMKDIHIWISEGDYLISGVSKLEEAEYSNNAEQITVKYDFDKMNTYLLFVAGSKKISLNRILNTTVGVAEATEEEPGMAIMYGFPITSKWYLQRTEMSSTDAEEKLTDNMGSWLVEKGFAKEETRDIRSYAKISSESRALIKARAFFLRNMLPVFEEKFTGKLNPLEILFCYAVYEDDTIVSASADVSDKNAGGIDRDSDSNRHSNFDKYTDELPFQNFESYIGQYGNCAGISHFTSYLYNNGTFPATGSYASYTYDLSTDPENNTLINKGLYDYKDSQFVNEHSGSGDNYLGTGLSSGEEEFVDMIGSYWTEGDDRINIDDYVKEYSLEYDFSTIQRTMDYIDQGKIVDVYMLLKDGSGHSVNIYDYFYTEAGEIIFRVYDSNIPQDNRKGIELNHAFCYLHVKEKKMLNGNSSFTYLYLPIKGDAFYMATSVHNLMNENALVIMDENWNVF